jgi:hypothetical protein
VASIFMIGTSGFCISVFGFLASFFLSLMCLSFGAFMYSLYVYVMQEGLLSFLPAGVNKLLLEVSIFDILVNVFIYKRTSKMAIAVLSPFMEAKDPEEAKKILKDEAKVPAGVYKAIFTQVSHAYFINLYCIGYH